MLEAQFYLSGRHCVQISYQHLDINPMKFVQKYCNMSLLYCATLDCVSLRSCMSAISLWQLLPPIVTHLARTEKCHMRTWRQYRHVRVSHGLGTSECVLKCRQMSSYVWFVIPWN